MPSSSGPEQELQLDVEELEEAEELEHDPKERALGPRPRRTESAAPAG
jgi:hypothetical protein